MSRWSILGFAGALLVAVPVAVTPLHASMNPEEAAELRSYFSGNGLVNRGLYELAAAEYRKFLAEHPNHEKAPTARYGLGFSLFQLGQLQEAAAELDALKDQNDFEFAAEALLILGQSHLTLEAYGSADEAFSRIIEHHADHELADETLGLQAETRYRAGWYDRVDEPAGALVANHPDSASRERTELFWGLADMARAKHESAAARFEGMLQRFPGAAHADQASLLLAQSLHRSKSVEPALRQYELVVDRATDAYTPDALYGLGLLLHQEGRGEQAGPYLDQLIDRYGRDELVPEGRLLRGRLWFEQGEYAQSIEHFKVLDGQPGPLSDDAAYWLAKCELRQSAPQRAANRLADALERFTDSDLRPAMTYDRAVALLRIDEPDEAIAVLGELRSTYPDDALAADALHLMAVTKHQQGRYAESLVDCRAFAAAYPKHGAVALAAFLAAENEFLDKNFEPAVAAYQAFLNAHPNDDHGDRARFRQGMALYQLGGFDDAVSALESVVDGSQTVEQFRAALLALGDIEFQNAAWAKAERHLADYVSFGYHQPGADNALLKLGLAQHRRDELERAVVSYGELIEHFQDGAHREQAVFERGQALVALGRPDEAVDAFETVLTADAESRFAIHALNHLGVIAMQRADHIGAAGYFARVAEAEGDSDRRAEAVYQQGQSLMAAEKYDAATEAFARIVADHAASPRAPQAAALEAIALARQGENELALAKIENVAGSHAASLETDLVGAMTYEKAWCERDLDRDADAITTYRELLTQPIKGALRHSSMLELAELEFDREGYEAAAEQLRSLHNVASSTTNVAPDVHEPAVYRLGVCEYHLENFAEAVVALEDFLERFPQSESVASASLFCGESLVRIGKHERAVEHLERVAKEHADDPACSASLLRLGESLAFLQHFERSESVFREHRTRFADDEHWYQAEFGIGWALENQNDRDGAIAAYQRVLDRHQGPTAARSQFQIGECLFALNQYEEAARELLKVDILFAYAEWSAAALFEAGRCFQELSDPVAARTQFEKVVTDFRDTNWATLADEQLAELSRSGLPGH